MERRRLGVYGLIGATVVAAVALTLANRLDVASLSLTVVVLIVATLTLQAAWLPPARLAIERQSELRHVGDLLFFSYPEPEVAGGSLPQEVRLEMYVAVVNTGGRRALLLGISLEAFLDSHGQPISSPLLPSPVLASQYRQWESRDLLAGTLHIQSETRMPPFVLEPDEVLSLRLRMSRGIDWSSSWNLARIKDAAASLSTAVTHAKMLLIYRRGQSVVRDPIVMPLFVQAQADFTQRLATVTSDFTIRPIVEPRDLEPFGSDSGFPIPR